MKLTLKIPVQLYDRVTDAMFAAEEPGEELTAEDYLLECLLAGLRRDQKARQRRLKRETRYPGVDVRDPHVDVRDLVAAWRSSLGGPHEARAPGDNL